MSLLRREQKETPAETTWFLVPNPEHEEMGVCSRTHLSVCFTFLDCFFTGLCGGEGDGQQGASLRTQSNKLELVSSSQSSSGTSGFLTHSCCCSCSSSESLRVTRRAGSPREGNSDSKLSSASSSAQRQEVVKARKRPECEASRQQLLPALVSAGSRVGRSCRLLFTCKHTNTPQ